jgi:flagellar biosynthesis protein FlhG
MQPSERVPAAGARCVVAVGGGRGGVGKSLVAMNLAIYFAQLGKSAVLVDADGTGANLHSHFGLPAGRAEPPFTRGRPEELTKLLLPTAVPGLSLLPAPHDSPQATSLPRSSRRARYLAHLRTLPAEYLVIDAGPGHGPAQVDLLLSADVPIVVTTPEPGAIETTYRFLRAAYRRRLRRTLLKDRMRLAIAERAIAELGVLPAPSELIKTLTRMDPRLAEVAWSEARRLRMLLVVNQTRLRNDLELGAWMSTLAQRHLGVPLEELGHIEQDDAVWLAVRRNRPLLVDSPTSKAGRNLERIARRVVAIVTTPESKAAPPALPGIVTLYDALGISRGASDEEIRRSYKRQREMYGESSLATASLLSAAQLGAEQARLDEAYDTLLDPVRRRAYDLSTFPDDAATKTAPAPPKPPLAAEQLLLQAELQREIGPDTEFDGALLRKVRESIGVDLGEISARTKIGRPYLAAIEEEDYAALPAPVYVRGFLLELARFLRLDGPQVQRTYLRRMREALGGVSEPELRTRPPRGNE